MIMTEFLPGVGHTRNWLLQCPLPALAVRKNAMERLNTLPNYGLGL